MLSRGEGSTYLDLLVILCLMQLRISFNFLTARTCWFAFNLLSTRTPRSFSASLFSTVWSPACIDAWSCNSSQAFCSSAFWTSWDFCQLMSPACQGPFGWLRFVSNCCQFRVIHKFTKGALYPMIQVINEDVKQHWSQCWLLGYFPCNWHPTTLCTTD